MLETFENRPQDAAVFIPLIRSYMSDRQVLCEVLGFKYCSTVNSTPFSLQKLTALMLQHQVITLDDILPWLVPDDKAIIRDYDNEMKLAKEYVKKMSVISTKDKEEEKEEKEVVVVQFHTFYLHKIFHLFLFSLIFYSSSFQDKYSNNQKFGLCEALLEVGAWDVALQMFNRLPDFCLTDQKPIALSLCKIIHAIIEPLYRK